MKLPEVGACVAVVLIAGLAVHCSDQRQQSQREKVAAFKASDRAADSVLKSVAPQIAAWRDSASKNARSAEAARAEARRLAGIARGHPALRSTSGIGSRDGRTESLTTGEDGSHISGVPGSQIGQDSLACAGKMQSCLDALRLVVDTLAQAYDLMVRVDSLNQLQLAAKDSIIQADSVMISALQATRAAAREAVKAQTCTIVFGIKCPSRNTVAIVSLGLGVVGGYALAR